MTQQVLDSLPSCPMCGGKDLDFSSGALFNWYQVFCKNCGCCGESSKTDTSDWRNRHTYARRGEAIKNWRSRLIEKRAYGAAYFKEKV